MCIPVKLHLFDLGRTIWWITPSFITSLERMASSLTSSERTWQRRTSPWMQALGNVTCGKCVFFPFKRSFDLTYPIYPYFTILYFFFHIFPLPKLRRWPRRCVPTFGRTLVVCVAFWFHESPWSRDLVSMIKCSRASCSRLMAVILGSFMFFLCKSSVNMFWISY